MVRPVCRKNNIFFHKYTVFVGRGVVGMWKMERVGGDYMRWEVGRDAGNDSCVFLFCICCGLWFGFMPFVSFLFFFSFFVLKARNVRLVFIFVFSRFIIYLFISRVNLSRTDDRHVVGVQHPVAPPHTLPFCHQNRRPTYNLRIKRQI
jgi:hypothetical protein